MMSAAEGVGDVGDTLKKRGNDRVDEFIAGAILGQHGLEVADERDVHDDLLNEGLAVGGVYFR
jgi:hypothetical protein